MWIQYYCSNIIEILIYSRRSETDSHDFPNMPGLFPYFNSGQVVPWSKRLVVTPKTGIDSPHKYNVLSSVLFPPLYCWNDANSGENPSDYLTESDCRPVFDVRQ